MLEQNAEYKFITEAADGLEVQKAEEFQPDVVLLDIGLPKMNGIACGRLIRQKAPNSRIIFLAQQSDIYVRQDALHLGAIGYVHKSRALTDLLPAIESGLRGRQFVSENLNVPLLDIFAGIADKSARWVETVVGLSNARDRMVAIAALKPAVILYFPGATTPFWLRQKRGKNRSS